MAERQHADGDVVLSHLEAVIVHLQAGGEVGEVQHHPLGFTRGARGVDEGEQIIHGVVLLAATQLQLARMVVAADEEGLEVAGLLAAAQIDGGVEGHDGANITALEQLQRLVKLGLFADEQGLDAGVAHYVARLLQRAGGVDGHADAAGGQDAEVGLGPLRHVARIDPHHLTLLMAGTDQCLGAVVHGLAKGSPTDGTPLPILLNPQGGFVAELGNPLAKQSNQVKLLHQKCSSIKQLYATK